LPTTHNNLRLGHTLVRITQNRLFDTET